MSKIPFPKRLADPRPILADGAMGTMIHASGAHMDEAFERLNLEQPALIQQVHARYIESGSDLIETNTFAANRYKLAEHGLESQVAEINRAGVEIAKRAIAESGRDDVYIAGSVGPLGMGLQPYGRLKHEDAREAFAEQIKALADAGVDALIFETFNDLAEIQLGLEVAREVAPELIVICQLTFAPDDRTLLGFLPGRVAHELKQAGADVIGVNCSGGPAQISRVLGSMRFSEPEARFSAMPNAGFPEVVNGRTMYPATVEYFADYATTFKAQGASIIGGCCGTTPEHIAAMRAALDDTTRVPRNLPRIVAEAAEEVSISERPHRPTELATKLEQGQYVVTVEMTPPRSHSFDRLIASANLLRESGADFVNIPDSPTARMRVSPWAVCQQVQTGLGIETILHFPTRGRNLLRVQGDLLGAHALGLRNIFVCMGDPTRIGDYPDAMDNYDIAPSSLIALIKQRMNVGVDQAGNSIGQPTSFTVGCALNMGATDLDKEIELTRKKIAAGADFALGQPVFEPHIAERFLERYEELTGEPLKLPVLMGIMPLFSLKHALFLNNEIPGINIPPSIMKRIEDAGENASAEGIRVAQELLIGLKPFTQGAYIIPAYGRYELAAEVIGVLHPAAS